jgi:7,8-dihydropterin-6-yl-methyl-4-(beta-D-ribofuranosyl)aminobenzene 5'-phosphate synthase
MLVPTALQISLVTTAHTSPHTSLHQYALQMSSNLCLSHLDVRSHRLVPARSLKCLFFSLCLRLLGKWGFAALPHAYRNLYGTGLSGVAPSTNIKALGMSPDEPEVPLLSRRHVGHASDLKAFLLARTRPIKIVARVNVFARDEREEGAGLAGEHLESREAELVLVGMSYKIAEGAWASGEIPRRCGPSHTSVAPDEAFDDMALYVKHTKGLVALTGCGHAGVENIMEYGLQVTGTDKLYAVIGGRARACRGYSLHWHCGYCGVTNCGEVGG